MDDHHKQIQYQIFQHQNEKHLILNWLYIRWSNTVNLILKISYIDCYVQKLRGLGTLFCSHSYNSTKKYELNAILLSLSYRNILDISLVGTIIKNVWLYLEKCYLNWLFWSHNCIIRKYSAHFITIKPSVGLRTKNVAP